MISLDALVREPTRIPDLTPAQRMEARRLNASLGLWLAEEPLQEEKQEYYLTLAEVAERLRWTVDRVKHYAFPRSVRVSKGQYSGVGLEAWERNRRMKGARA